MKAPLPVNEIARLEALGQYNILDTAPEPEFDDSTNLAAQICETPIALFTLVDHHRLWIKSNVGLTVTETNREGSFCAHTILGNEVFIIPDALADERFATNPFVTAEPYIRFYAGAPLITSQGHALGALCVIDSNPRELNPQQLGALQALSRQIMTQLELRRTLAQLVQAKQENQQLQQKLRHREQELLDLFEDGSIGLHCLDANGIIVWANQAELDLLGYTRQEYVGRPIADFYTDKAVVEDVLQRLSRNETLHKYEAKLRCKDGSFRYVLINSNALWEDGKFSHTRCFTRDITEYKQAEEERNALRTALQGFFDLSIDLLCIAGVDGYFKRLNLACEKTLGYSNQELQSQPFIDFVHPEDKAATLAEVQKLTTGIPTIYLENRYRCKDGSYKWLAWTAFPHVEDGLLYCVARDITQLKCAEQERLQLWEREQAARNQITKILESITDAFFALDTEWRFTYLNQQAERLLQRKREELLGQCLWDEFPDAVTSLFDKEYHRAVRKQVSVEFEAFYPPLNTWFYVHAYPGEQGLSVYFEDISDRKQAEEALRSSEERYRLLFESNPHPMWVNDIDTLAILAVNEAAIKHYGYSREEFLALTIADIRPAVDIPALLENMATLRPGLNKKGVWRHCKKDGSLIEVEITAYRLTFGGRQAQLVLANDVTEQRGAQKALIETTQFQRAILDSANYAIIATTPDGIIRTFNRAAERLLGYTAEEVVGKLTPMIIHNQQEVVQRAQELTQELGIAIEPGCESFVAKARLGKIDEREWTYIRKDGSCFPVLLSVTAVRDLDDNITGFLGIGSDITERKEAETLLEKRIQQQAVIAELGQRALAGTELSALMDEATALVAQSLDVEYCQVLELMPNRNTLLLRSGVGWHPGLMGWATVSTATDSQAGYTLTTKEPVIVEDLLTETRFSDPTLLHKYDVVSGLSVIIPGSSRPFGVLGAHSRRKQLFTQENVHFLQTVANVLATAMERQQAEEELQRQHRRSQLFAEITLKIRQSLQLEVILQTTVTEIQKILQVDRVLLYRVLPNGTGCTVTEAVQPGWPAILGMSFEEEVFPLEYQELYRQGQIRAIADVQQAYAELTPCLLQFLEPWQVKAKLVVPILLSGQLWGLLIAHHCTSPRQWTSFETELLQQLSEQISLALAQAQLLERETRQRLELARSNAELQEFAYVASHDLQEPLRKIQAFGDRLRVKYSEVLTEQGCDYLIRMQNAAERMQALINDLLTLSRVTTRAQPFAPTKLTQVVKDVLSDLEVRIQQTGGRIEVGELPTLEADPIQMRQLLQNLIGNALKFHRQEEPPVIKIHSRWLPDGERPPTEGMNRVERCQILVEDNGIGFHEKYLDRIFNAFQRLHGRSEYEGTGMGLAICRKIAERHNGNITAQSITGYGATFIVTLPLQQCQGDTVT
ncbi:PAS domain S-box protein [Allocoleopsis sp.]|uniref:PAS domain S-box protein n=1 Tax=Allocoleopsis sp. TaxID=3088169 RepID=UPI002FD47491